MPAMSLPVATSIPSRPGDELTSRRSGPFWPLMISTPATFSPNVFVANKATFFSSGVSFI